MTTGFGQELRRRREDAGHSLSTFSMRVHYSVGYLSKIENGHKLPTAELARLCDAVLNANGQLVALAPDLPQPVVPATSLQFDALRSEPAAVLSEVPVEVLRASAHSDAAAEGFEGLLAAWRELGRRVSPSILLDGLRGHTLTTDALGRAASDQVSSSRLFLLAALFAEYTGWMAQESGDEPAALYWTDRAAQLADTAGDRDLARYALLRRADLALDRYDAASAVAYARQVQDDRRISPMVRGLAFLREAQGLSLFGESDSCLRTLDQARISLGEVSPVDRVLFGSTGLADPVAMITGWALYELGRPGDAAETVAKEVLTVAAGSLRTRARFAARLALAYAASGEVDAACEVVTDLLPDARQVDSATVRADLRALLRSLSRWNSHPSVRELRPLVMEVVSASRHPAVKTSG